MSAKFYFEILPAEQKKVLQLLSSQKWLNPFYLVGGTALALQLGHRQSDDFDFFSVKNIDNKNIISSLTKVGQFELIDEAENTVNGLVNNVKVSFIKYEYPLIKSTHIFQTMSLADLYDIALMKISAISGRGAKKDFIDLFFLLNHFSLSGLFNAYKDKYGVGVSNFYHLQKSLVYFDDAENEPMPKMLKHVDWNDIKKTIILKVKELGF